MIKQEEQPKVNCKNCQHSGLDIFCEPYNKYTKTNDTFDKRDRNKNGDCLYFKQKIKIKNIWNRLLNNL